MVQITGKYKLIKNENFAEFLVSTGAPVDKAEELNNLKSTIEIILDGKNVIIKSDALENQKGILTTLILDQEVTENLPNGKSLQSTATLNNDTLTISSTSDRGFTGSRVYKFSDSDLIVTMTREGSDILSKRYYQRN